jgi:exopolyphosphatase/guanosine-5'-triphosphate,3'-diphosphate pyrophosphatase
MSQQTQQNQVQSLAAIDIGSNSIRMTLGQLLPDGQIEIIEKAQRPVRLGQDTFRYSVLEPETMRAAVSILREFKQRLDQYQIQHVWAVATSAIREAHNTDVFLDRVLTAAGIEVDIIDASLERRLTVSAVRSILDDRQPAIGAQTLICEVGGGSTMMTVMRRGKLITSQSLGLGSIRLPEMLGAGSRQAGQLYELMENEIASVLASVEGLIPLGQISTFFAIGADARFAASQVGKIMANPSFHCITRPAVEKFVEWLKSMTIEQLVTQSDLSYTDAETLIPAMLIFRTLMRSTKAKELIIPQVSMRDGVLLELARRCNEQEDTGATQEVVQSALILAEKYKINIHHAKQAAGCALRLFDELKTVHKLPARARLFLEVAALLHEAGTFVSTRGYHKHTWYLIANSEIFGLTRSEVAIVAHVARYHRRSGPKPTHVEFMSLPRESRILVSKLASLLRLAKALNITDAGQIGRIQCKCGQDAVSILVPPGPDMSVSRRSVELRDNMFEDIFGYTLEIETGSQ